jgi:hypothetical protein
LVTHQNLKQILVGDISQLLAVELGDNELFITRLAFAFHPTIVCHNILKTRQNRCKKVAIKQDDVQRSAASN